ncbi:hypothetical protein FHG87_016888 [Trinorchestia longiramus]|nr:hypothetical protein FHG87_016888 [Trinorchestia longiramus]
MGWQQFLNNSSLPLKWRLHGAMVAFLGVSNDLSTQQKEDVVILWLTRLVKEKQMSAWQEDTDSEQELVWRHLDQVFSSQRLQQLIHKAWTCPITSAFPQSIINVLGAPSLGAETRRLVLSTACSIISTPILATVITNSTSLSLQVATALLDAAIATDWARVEVERLQRLPGHLDNDNSSSETRPWTQNKFDRLDAANSADLEHLLYDERLLKALSILLDDVASQLLVKNDDSAVKFCCQQLLKQMVSLELSAEAYNGPFKDVLLEKMSKLIKDSLFNTNVTAQYATFLSFLNVEDCKAFSEVSLIPVVLSSISALMSSESASAASRTLTLFYEGFLRRFPEDDYRVKMLACLLHMTGIVLPGDVISCDSEALEFIERRPMDARAQERMIVALIKPLQSLDRITKGSRLNTYLVLLLRHLTAQQPLSRDWFLGMRGLLTLLPEDHPEELVAALGEVLIVSKPDEHSLDIVSDLLHDLLQHYSSTATSVAFVSVLMQAIVAKKHKLKSHKEILPFTSSPDHVDLRVLLPPRFLSLLSLMLGSSEPLVFCDLFSALLTGVSDLLLPLFSAADEGSGRAVAGCCWVLSAVLAGACPTRMVSVQHFAEKMMHSVLRWSQQLVDPLLRLQAHENKLDSARCCGVLLLAHAFAAFQQDLRSCDAFTQPWQDNSPVSSSSLVPHTCPNTWAAIISSVEVSTDVMTRCLLLRLVLLRLQYLHVEGKRSRSCHLLIRSPSKGLVHHAPSGQAGESQDELIASLCSTFKKILDSSSAKDAPKLVRDLLSDNLLASVHTVSSCLKAVAKYVLSAYLTYPKLVQMAILGQANLAVLIPQLVQSALGRLASALKLHKETGGVAKKRKLSAEDDPERGEQGNLEEKSKKQKRENGGVSEGKNKIEDNCRKQKVSEKIDENENNSHDYLLTILQTVNIRLHCLEKGDDKKRINKDSLKMKQHLGRIAELVSEGHHVIPVQYNDGNVTSQICNFFLDIRLSALSVPQIVVMLQAFMGLFLLSDYSDKKQKKVILALLRCINVCFQALPVDVGVVASEQLPLLATRLVSLRSRPSSMFAATKANCVSKMDFYLVVNFDTMLNFVLRQLVQLRGEQDVVGLVAEFLMQRAGNVSTRDAGADVHRLQTASQLVSLCAQAVKEGRGQRSAHCRAAVCKLALWGMPSSAAPVRASSPDSVLYSLSMYSELLALEQSHRDARCDDALPPRGRHLNNGTDVSHGGMESETHDSHDTKATRSPEKIIVDENTEQSKEEFDMHQKVENSTGSAEEENAKYLEHLATAWRLVKFCLSSDSSRLQSCALQFLMRVKSLPPHLRPQCQDQEISSAILAFFQAQMSAGPECGDAGGLCRSEESSNTTVLANKQTNIMPPGDLAALNKQPLAEFLSDCSLETYQSLLRGLLGRSKTLDGFLAPRTLGMWQLLMEVDVGTIEGRRTKRAALRTLTQVLVRHLRTSCPPSSACEGSSSTLSAGAMVSLLEVLTSVMKQPLSLPHQTVMQVLSAASASTCHLSTPHFVLVWQKQVALLSTTLMSRTGAWSGRVSGLMSTVLFLVTTLAQRSSAHSPHANTHKEVLTSCCLSLEQLLRKLHPLQRDLYHVLHLSVGSIIAALQQHSVIPPVRSVLDAEIYKLLKMCSPSGLDHLAVALPAETRLLLHHYRNNFNKYYAVDHTKE